MSNLSSRARPVQNRADVFTHGGPDGPGSRCSAYAVVFTVLGLAAGLA
jgi:hypothetical protein